MSHISDAFNAKHLKTNQLVHSFVPSQKFAHVAQNGHTLLLGPRGSGKTTLLRMLSAETLPHWEHKEANKYKEIIGYEGIYVPGDLVWGEMLKSLSQPGVPQDCANEFSYGAFCTHVFISSIQAMEASLATYVNKYGEQAIEQKAEALIESYQTIARLLKFDIDKFSLSRIRNELYIRFSELGEYPSRVARCQDYNYEKFCTDLPFINIQLKSTLEAIFDSFDRALARPDHRWAVLLDEFEIAPKVLLDRVIQGMRSSAPKIIFKVALVPCGNHQDVKAEISNTNDHKVVELWYRSKADINEFCNNLLRSKYGIKQPEKVFGKTKYINNSHGNNALWEKEFHELMEKDDSFHQYIKNHDINITKVFSGEDEKTSNIRKIAPRVAFRNAFKNEAGIKKGRKSLYEFYAGWEAISRISEGNPRWLIATIDALLATSNDLESLIPLEKQYPIILSTCEAFSSMIASTALKDNMGISTDTPPYSLLESVGKFFNDSLIKASFQADPPGTFVVDSQINKDIENSLRIALNHGAIVATDEGQDFWNYRDLHNMRFRISYLLSPIFFLPLRMEKARNLSNIIYQDNDTKPERKKIKKKPENPENQGELFNE